jgi:hypothetical protein
MVPHSQGKTEIKKCLETKSRTITFEPKRNEVMRMGRCLVICTCVVLLGLLSQGGRDKVGLEKNYETYIRFWLRRLFGFLILDRRILLE